MGDNSRTPGSLLREDLRGHRPAHNLDFNEKIREMKSQGKEIYHFGFGQSPFSPMEGMVQALREHAGENAYLNVTGIPELRSAIVDMHAKHDGVHLDKDGVVVGPGSKELIFLLMQVFHGDILLTSPTWPTYKPQAELAGHKTYIINNNFEQQWRLTPQALEHTVKSHNLTDTPKLLIFCNPDNPTGVDYREEHLRELSEAFRKHNVIVLSDEIYGRLHYEANHQTLTKFYPEGTILSSGFSKWASAGGWRVGYNIFPPRLYELRDAVRSAASHTYSCAAAPMQYALAKALRDEHECSAYIRHTTRIMKAVSCYCYKELTAVGVTCVQPSAGYYCLPDFEVCREAFAKRGITTGMQMCDAMLKECKVALMSGGPAFLRPLHEFNVRFCFVNFNGDEALAASRKIGLEQELPDNFVENHATPVHLGVQSLKQWIRRQLEGRAALQPPQQSTS